MGGESIRSQYLALQRGRRDLETLLGVRVKWFRAPYGHQEPETVLACHLAGMRPLMWSTSAHDWQPDPIDEQLAHVAGGLTPGAIVLLHDGSARIAEPQPPPPSTQPELLERLLDLLHERSLRPVTMSALCASGAVVRAPWFERWLHH
jgi:peptidoglycan/xylan/chitin deacetylase (PgdA/CDA1 family)